MLLKWRTVFGAVIIFLVINKGGCERLKSQTEFDNLKEDTNLNFLLELFIDYLNLDDVRAKIDELYPGDDLLFIGQTLAWVGQLMIIRNELVPSAHRTINLVPFSGNFYKFNNDTSSRTSFIRDLENLPTEEEFNNYKNTLRGYGLDPRSILERYNRTGRRTVIARKIHHCLVLKSFLEIFFRWAKEEGISPSEMRKVIKVFIVSVNLTQSTIPSAIVIKGFTVDLAYLDLTSPRSIIAIDRAGYPDRFEGYVRLVPYYPPSLWNESPPEFDQNHEQRRRMIIDSFRGTIQVIAEVADVITSTTASPTLVLRDPSGMYGACRFNQSRSKRDLSSHDIVKKLYLIGTFSRNALEILEMEFARSSNVFFDEFFEDRLKNSSSGVSKILNQVCNKYYDSRYHYSNDEETVSSEQLYFSPVISEKIKTTDNLSYDLDFLIEDTRDSAFHCPEDGDKLSLEVINNDIRYLQQIMLAFFGRSSEGKIKSCTNDLVNYY